MANSKLVEYTKLSPFHSGKRKHTIDRITIHCVVGQVTAARLGEIFSAKDKNASCNYGIDKYGKVVLIVDEQNRSWCSSNEANDQRAVTIECASASFEPYAFMDVVYNKLIDLCVDICKRNGKTKLLWIPDKSRALAYEPKPDEMLLTVHRWFKNKACPGDWMYSRLGNFASLVTDILAKDTNPTNSEKKEFRVRVSIDDLNIRKGPGTTYDKTGKYTGVGVFTIVETASGKGSTKGWGKLISGAGWISLDYCDVL